MATKQANTVSVDLQLWIRIGAMNLAGAPDSDPARREAVSFEPHRSAALRFMGSLDLQLWTRIGTMNLVGAPDSDPARREVVSIEPHRSAALRFMESLVGSQMAHGDVKAVGTRCQAAARPGRRAGRPTKFMNRNPNPAIAPRPRCPPGAGLRRRRAPFRAAHR